MTECVPISSAPPLSCYFLTSILSVAAYSLPNQHLEYPCNASKILQQKYIKKCVTVAKFQVLCKTCVYSSVLSQIAVFHSSVSAFTAVFTGCIQGSQFSVHNQLQWCHSQLQCTHTQLLQCQTTLLTCLVNVQHNGRYEHTLFSGTLTPKPTPYRPKTLQWSYHRTCNHMIKLEHMGTEFGKFL